jgi:hypothetical protein
MEVFVSRPTWIHDSFREGLRVFLTRLSDLGINARTLGATDQPTRAPLDEVISLLDKCRGAVILGYPQIQINTGQLKNQWLEAPLSLPTEWNHIEAGLAYARKLPLLVIHHVGIARGIFDRGALNSFLFERDLTDSAWASTEDIGGAIRSWRDNVLQYAPIEEPKRASVHDGLVKYKDKVWSAMAVGRKLADSRRLGAGYREKDACRIVDLSEFYVRIQLLSSDLFVTLPLSDVVITFDDKENRPMIEVRS